MYFVQTLCSVLLEQEVLLNQHFLKVVYMVVNNTKHVHTSLK